MGFFKKRSTAWAVLIVTVVVSFFIGQAGRPASEVQILPPGEYIQDNAGVLTDATEKYMTEMNNGLVSKVGGEIHVVTVDTTGNEDIFDKALDLAVETGLSANSCMFFIAVDDVDAVIIQGEDLLYAFSDDELSYILTSNFTEKDFRTENIDSPARRSFDDLITLYEQYYGINVVSSRNIVLEQTQIDYEAIMVLAFILIVVLIIIAVSAATRPRRYKQRTVIVPGGTSVYRTGNYPPRGSYTTPPSYRYGKKRENTTNRGGSFSAGSSRTGGFGSSSRGGSFSSGSSRGGSFSSSRSSFGSSSRSGGFGGGSRGGSFGGGSRGGGFRK